MKIKFLFIVLFSFANCDMKTHCRKSTSPIGTTWTFLQEKSKKSIDLYTDPKVCGHSRPNSQNELISKEILPENDLERVVIKITGEKSVEGTDAKGSAVTGSWNIYFEQALVVELSNGNRYMANVDDGSIGPTTNPTPCKNTMVGFV
jgi:hypothetical protein